MTSAPSPTDMDGLQLVVEHASLAPPSRRRQQPSLIATVPPELILQIRKNVLELKLWTDEWENAEEAHRTSESRRKVCVAWYVALADDVTEMTAWSSRGCEKLARYLEKDGKGARV